MKDLERIGVDAIIVQDLAVAKLAQRVAPKLHLHGSTQMTAATLDAVRFYESLGFTRVVLARELSLEKLNIFVKNCTAEIESLCTWCLMRMLFWSMFNEFFHRWSQW